MNKHIIITFFFAPLLVFSQFSNESELISLISQTSKEEVENILINSGYEFHSSEIVTNGIRNNYVYISEKDNNPYYLSVAVYFKNNFGEFTPYVFSLSTNNKKIESDFYFAIPSYSYGNATGLLEGDASFSIKSLFYSFKYNSYCFVYEIGVLPNKIIYFDFVVSDYVEDYINNIAF
jgi:hypothetical protein